MNKKIKMYYKRNVYRALALIILMVVNTLSGAGKRIGALTNSGPDHSKGKLQFTVMQFNIWQEGTQVENGFSGIVGAIVQYHPDFVSLVEVRNYKGVDFFKRLRDSLYAKGLTYYANTSNDNGMLSKYPIDEFTQDGELPSMHKIVVKIGKVQLAIYSSHLDYTHYAEYLPRGYDGSGNGKLPTGPETDVQKILAEDAGSTRPQAIATFIEDAKKESAKGRAVILAGDFNEASHLDWTEKVKHLYDHNGAVVPWPSSRILYANNFKDSYRVIYPDELAYPGFTWVVANPWIKDADERDRIDFIYYLDNGKIRPVRSILIGPDYSYVGTQLIKENGKDEVSITNSVWPSDHRALLTTFICKG
ncbi:MULTISPECIES: endonuclease/exonuclease/phosphatase family protein [Chitinophagaceae]